MNVFEQIQRGRTAKPPRLLTYGIEGIGKSTFGSQAPKPIFVQCEDGLDEIDCDKFPLATHYDDVIAALGQLGTQEHGYETVVIDSLDWLERLLWDKLCAQYGVDSIEKVDGGYARGYTHALTLWREVIDHLNVLRNAKNMVVILIAHSKVERFEDPECSPYDRYCPRLHKHAAALVSEWCDAVLVCHAKNPHAERGRRLQPQTDDRARHRQGRRRAHPAVRRRASLHRQKIATESTRNCRFRGRRSCKLYPTTNK